MAEEGKLISRPKVKIKVFGVGGGRAVDTAKTYCALYDKPLFAFPTIASNCASCTSLSVMYNPDGTFKEY